MDYVGQIRAAVEGGIRLSFPVTCACGLVIFSLQAWPAYFSDAPKVVLPVVSIVGLIALAFLLVGLLSLLGRGCVTLYRVLCSYAQSAIEQRAARRYYDMKIEYLHNISIGELLILTRLLASGQRSGFFNADEPAIIDLVQAGILTKSLTHRGEWVFQMDELLWREMHDLPAYELDNKQLTARVLTNPNPLHHLIKWLPQNHPTVIAEIAKLKQEQLSKK